VYDIVYRSVEHWMPPQVYNLPRLSINACIQKVVAVSKAPWRMRSHLLNWWKVLVKLL